MQGHFWHLFLTQLIMLFHMVALVLLSIVAFSTTFWLVEILQQPIRFFEMSGFKATMESRTEGTMWKGIENCVRNWCQKWPCILFGAIYRENKQWGERGLMRA